MISNNGKSLTIKIVGAHSVLAKYKKLSLLSKKSGKSGHNCKQNDICIRLTYFTIFFCAKFAEERKAEKRFTRRTKWKDNAIDVKAIMKVIIFSS